MSCPHVAVFASPFTVSSLALHTMSFTVHSAHISHNKTQPLSMLPGFNSLENGLRMHFPKVGYSVKKANVRVDGKQS